MELDHKDFLFFIVVVYNKECKNSPTCVFLQQQAYSDVIVVDNSTSDFQNQKFCENMNWEYISMNGNKGLSAAYNKALDHLNNKSGYVIIADDDSQFDDKFITVIKGAIKKYNGVAQVFLPLVHAGNNIYSPNIIGSNGFPKRIKNLDQLKGKQLSGINSGMVVNLNIYKNYRYDQDLFLDYIDHDFCAYCRKNNINMMFVPKAIIKQNSFFTGKPNKSALKHRRDIYEKDFIYFVKKNGLNHLLGYKKIYVARFSRFLKEHMSGN